MAQHGYLREYDEGPDRGEDRDRDWSDRDRERGWRGSERDWSDHDRGFMFDRNRDRDDDRGFFNRMGDRARSAFTSEDEQYRGSHQDDWRDQDRGSSGYGREHGYGGFQGDFSRSGRQQGGFGGRGDWERSPRNFSGHQDDHYRSWRDRQMEALDRDYADYCREREQQFHSDFDSWRRNRQQQGGSENKAAGQVGELELTHERALAEEGNTPSPVGEATLGTNNSENTARGRR